MEVSRTDLLDRTAFNIAFKGAREQGKHWLLAAHSTQSIAFWNRSLWGKSTSAAKWSYSWSVITEDSQNTSSWTGSLLKQSARA